MFALNSVTPAVFDSVKRHRIPEYFLTVFRAALLLSVDVVVIEAEKAADPRILIERDADGYFFQVVYSFKKGSLEHTYTLQFTVTPGATLISRPTMQLLPMLGVHAMEPMVSIVLNAKRNGVVYYEFGTSGKLQESAASISRALG